MMEKFLNIFRIPDLRKKLIFTGLLLLVYRLGGKVPVPGIDRAALAAVMENFANSLLGLYDMFAGGFFSQASIFALGIMPYISASIIIQLLGAVMPYFQRLQKEGEEGRKKIIQLTKNANKRWKKNSNSIIDDLNQISLGVKNVENNTIDIKIFITLT